MSVAACGPSSKGDKIVADADLFPKDLPKAVAYARGQCPEMHQAAQAHAKKVGAASRAAMSLQLPASHHPQLSRITGRHGAADKSEGQMHHFGDLAFRANASGAVVQIDVDCTPAG